jgi:hypothetical protein
MKKETLIVVFYILYFTWLLTVTYLSPSVTYLNYFTFFIAAFYFIFVKAEWDTLFFISAAILGLILQWKLFTGYKPTSIVSFVDELPLWIPLAWGTTVVALKTFFQKISK